MREKVNIPSTSHQPDLDWSQVRETVRMLHLAVAQIDMTLREGEDSIQTLSYSFTSMIAGVKKIAKSSEKLVYRDQNLAVIHEIDNESKAISDKMHESVMAFQFYDKLSQRLGHVSQALAALGELVNDQSRLYNPTEWTGLQGKIRAKYSMREEQQMFDLLLSGASIEDALAMGTAVLHEAADENIELF